MRARALIAIAGSLMLASCQPPTYDITLAFRDGGLMLEAHGSDIWPFGWSDDTIDAGSIEISDRDRVVWRIAAGPTCAQRYPNPFPIKVGTLPLCFEEEIPFRGIRVNTLYRVDGDGLRDGSGYFRIRPRISNHSWDEVQDELRTWPTSDLVTPTQTEESSNDVLAR